MNREINKELKTKIKQFANDKNRDFTMKICPTKHHVLGVKVPQIRTVARQVPSELIEKFINIEPSTYEEVLARGFLIARLPYEKMLKHFNSQLEYIDDWSTCDLFCSAISKLVRKNQEDFLEKKIKKLLVSKKEFSTRVGLVLLKCCYIDLNYLKYIFDEADKISNREEYYIKMALAWLISECFIKFPTATMEYLLKSKIPKWTFNKSISKICDSYRVDSETKKLLKTIRK